MARHIEEGFRRPAGGAGKLGVRRSPMGPRLLVASVLLAALLPGCAPGGSSRSYRVEQSGRRVGSQSVSVEKTAGAVLYRGVERRPFLEYDTETSRRLSVSGDGDLLNSYYSTRRVPGAVYSESVMRSGGRHEFFSDRLQTFDYVPDLAPGGNPFPFEPDSACLAQALADRFFSSGHDSAVALAVVPSISSTARELSMRKDGRALRVSGEGVPDLVMEFSGGRVLESLRGGGIEVVMGGEGHLSSRAHQPSAGTRRVREVRIPVPERLPGGEDLELAGSLYLPAGTPPYRAVVLAGDTGPRDRTGAGVLSQFADELAGRGLAVLSCDRRGVPESGGSYPTYTRLTAVRDLNAQVDFLSLRKDIDRDSICVLGHGEGGQTAVAVASANPYVSSLVLAATPSVRLWPDLALLRAGRQEEGGSPRPAETESARLLVRNQESLVESTGADHADLEGRRVFLGWMRSQGDWDPLAVMGTLEVPVLVVQGGRDHRVPAGQAEEIMAALGSGPGPGGELALFPGLGHGFGPELSEAASLPYRRHPVVSREVLDRVGAWVAAR